MQTLPRIIVLLTISVTPAVLAGCATATERQFDAPSASVVDAIGALYDSKRNPDQRRPQYHGYQVTHHTKDIGIITEIDMHDLVHGKIIDTVTNFQITPVDAESTNVRIRSKNPQSVLDILFGPSRDPQYERERLAEIEARLGLQARAVKKKH